MRQGIHDCRLDNQIAIVTGASPGIDYAVAAALADAGAAVAVNYNSQAEPAERLTSEIVAKGGRAFAHGADVSDEDAVARPFQATLDRWGRWTSSSPTPGCSGTRPRPP